MNGTNGGVQPQCGRAHRLTVPVGTHCAGKSLATLTGTHLSTRQYCGTPADCLPHTQPICRPIGLSDLRADVAEQVGDVVLDELVVHNRLPVRVEQPLELVDLLLLVRLGRHAERQRVLCGTYSRRTV